MDIVALLVMIIVVTILVTIVLAVVTYVAYKLRLSREPTREEDPGGLRYFVHYRPPGARLAGADDGSALDRLAEDVDSLEGHATEA